MFTHGAHPDLPMVNLPSDGANEAFRYRILVEWSDEDQAFIAGVPALPGCMAHGPTAEKAAREAELAAGLMLDVMKEDGKALPPIDAVADYSGQLRLRLPKSLHETVSQLATAEGVSINTLMLSLIAEGCGRRETQAAGTRQKAGKPSKRKAVA